MKVRRFLLEKQVVVSSRLAVIPELVVAKGEVVEALAATLRRSAENFGKEHHSKVLLGAHVRLDEALKKILSEVQAGPTRRRRGIMYIPMRS